MKLFSLLAAILATSFVFSQSACFTSASENSSVGISNAFAIEKGDFDGDANLDLILGSNTTGTLKAGFCKGNGNNQFADPILFEIGDRVISMKAADFNNDGNLDVVAVNGPPTSDLKVAFGNGNGTFLPPFTLTPLSGVTAVEVADLNGDGLTDIVVSNLTGGFQVFLNNIGTPGTFTASTMFGASTGSRSITLADVNNDGNLDAIVVNANDVSVNFGNGAGSFGAPTAYVFLPDGFNIKSADLNGDGWKDIVALSSTQNKIAVFKNNGSGGFLPKVEYATGITPNGLALVDINLDGKIDAIVSNNGESTVSMYQGNGDGTFAPDLKSVAFSSPKDIVTGNFNADTYPDIAISAMFSQVMTTYAGNGTFQYQAINTYPTALSPKSIAHADFNGDGNLDMVSANSGSNNIGLHLGNAAGQFAAATYFGTLSNPTSVATGDFNNDGKQDVVVTNYTTGMVSIFLGNGAGSLTLFGNYACGASPHTIGVGDLNGDSNLDVVVTNFTASTFSLLLGTGSGSLGAPTPFSSGFAGPADFVLKDFDGNGKPDMVIATSNKVVINRATLSAPWFGSSSAISASTIGATSVDVGDVDGDGFFDLVYTANTSFYKLKGNGTSFAGPANTYSTSETGPKSIRLADFNNDGELDALVSYTAGTGVQGNVSLYMGTGLSSPEFIFHQRFTVGTGPLGITTGDFNNDGRIDAAVVNNVSNSFSVLLNTTPVITVSGPTTFCNGGGTTLSSTASDDYVWTNGATTQVIAPSTSGLYSVTTTEGPGTWCSAESNKIAITVTAGPAAPTVTASGPTAFCAGGSVVLTSSQASGNTWSNGATTQSITVTTPGVYTVNYTSGGCTSVESTPITVTTSETPVITASGPTTFCTGGSVTLTSSVTSNIAWSTGATTPSITVSTAGTYTVTNTVGACPALTSAPVVVTIGGVAPAPTITASGTTVLCSGFSVVLTSSSPLNNIWSTGATTQSIIVSTAGFYNAFIDDNGCVSPNSNTINVTVGTTPSAPTVTVSGVTTFCAGGSVTLTSSAATGNTWSNGATSQAIVVSTSGTYSVTQTAGGCVSPASSSTTVTVNPIPATPVITAGGPTTFCTGGSVVLTSSSATGNLWSNGATTQSITVSTAGTYSVVVSAAGCSSGTSNTISVTINPIPAAPSITAGGLTTFCAGGSVVLTSSLPTGNTWSTSATTQSITVTTSGSYTVTNTFSGCTSVASSPIVITVNPLPSTPTISPGGSTTFCTGGTVTLTSSAAASYLWSNGGTTQAIIVGTSGIYSVTTALGGCNSVTSAPVSVTENPLPPMPTITASGPTTFCAGGLVTLTSSSPINNFWSNGATTQSITVSTSGTYTVFYNNGSCVSPTSSPTVVTVSPIPTTPTISAGGSTTFCVGGSVTLTSSATTGNLWSNGATTQSIVVSTAGPYSVLVNVSGCNSLTSNTINVTVNPVPATPTVTASGSTTICAGGTVTLTSSATTGNTWSNGATTQSIVVSTAGTYSVVHFNGTCTSASSTPITVTVNPIPTTPVITAGSTTTFCAGSNVILTSSSTTGNLWSTGETAQSISVAVSGSYSVVVNQLGCFSPTSNTIVVTVNPIPATPTITAGGSTTFCSGNSVILTSSSPSGNTWSNGATTQSITVSASGTFSVYVTTFGCQSPTSATISVTVNPTPAVPIITPSGSTTFCSGGSVTLVSSSPTNNVWSNSATTQSINVTTSGTYTVVGNDGTCQSAASLPITVTVNPTPAQPTITASGPITFCAGDSVTLTSSALTGNVWSNGSTTQSITVLAAGNYSVYSTAGSCQSITSAVTTVVVNPVPAVPVITVSGPTTFCSGGSVTLTSTGGSGHVWSSGQTTPSILVTTSGSYSVVRNNLFCQSVSLDTIIVVVNPTPVQPTISASGPTTFCAGDMVTLTSSSATGNVWNTGATTQSITVSIAGSYSVYVTSGLCQSATSTVTTVIVNPLPATPTISVSGPTTFCSGNNVVLTSSSATGNVWSTGATTQSITVATSGIFTVYVNNGTCTSATSVATTVTVNPTPAIPTISASGPVTFCSGDMVILTSSSATGNVWNTGATTQSITVSTAGTYSVYVNSGLCQSASSLVTTVIINPLPATPTISVSGVTTFCSGNNVILTSSSATGNIWSTGATTQSITVTTSGAYSVYVNNGTCTSATSVATTVTVNPTPVQPTITASGPTTFCVGDMVTLTSSSSTGNVWSTGATTQSITVSAAGNYSVHVIDGPCQSITSLVTAVTVNPLPATPTISVSGVTTFCSGNNVVLTSSSVTGNVWSTGATTQSITVTTSGTYSVYVNNGTCTSATSVATTITVNPTPAQPTITASGPITFCVGDMVTLTSSALTGNVWSNGATTQSITVSSAGNYSVHVIDGPCQSPTSLITTITVNPLPATPTISVSGPTTFCSGGSVILTSSSATGNVWSTGATPQSITVTTSGSYTVYVNNGTCTSTTSVPTAVLVNPTPATPTISASGPTTFCIGDSVILTSSSTTGNLWSNGLTTQSITVLTPGNYSVHVTSGPCQSITSAITSVIVNPLPVTPTISTSGATTFCSGGSVTLTASGATGHVWSTGQTTKTITVTTSGNYTVYVNNGTCTSLTSDTVTVIVNPTPVTPTITASSATTFCAGGSVVLTSSSATNNFWSTGATTQSITVSASGSYTVYVNDGTCQSITSVATIVTVNPIPSSPSITNTGLSTFCSGGSTVLVSSSPINNVWSTGATTQSITVTTSGTYTAVVDDGNCISPISNSVTILVNPTPAVPTISTSGVTTFCTGGSVVLTSSSSTGNIWSTGETTQSITITSSGNYSVSVNDGTCQSAPSTITVVTVNPIPTTPVVTAGSATSFCTGGSVVLTSSSLTGNVWSTGATTQSITVSASGTYSVVVNQLGCNSATSNTINVIVNPIPATPTVTPSSSTTFCMGEFIFLTSSASSGNVWSTGETTQSIIVTLGGIYSVYVDNGYCQSSTVTTTVTVNPIPAVPTITAGGPTTFCTGSSVVLTSSSPTNNVWSNGATTQSITVTTAGSYSVVLNVAGCSSASSTPVVITTNPTPATPIVTVSGPTTFCTGGSVVLTSSSLTNNYWSTGATSQTITVSASGSYTVYVNDGTCQSITSASTTITVNPIPSAPVVTAGGPTTFCAGGSVVLTSSSANGNLWSTGATTQSITVTASGNYSVTTTLLACTSPISNTVNVTVNPLPTSPVITNGSTASFCNGSSLVLSSSSPTDNLWSTGATTQTITVNAAGTYSVSLINGFGCSSASAASITVSAIPLPVTPTISAGGPTAFCTGGSVVLTSSSPSNNSWSNGSTQQSITVNTSGVYTVQNANGTGCLSLWSAPMTITVNPLPAPPVITATGSTSFCAGGQVLLQSSYPTGNTWSNGSILNPMMVSNSGTYTAVHTNANGCTSTNSNPIPVVVYPAAAIPVISASGPTSFCIGGTVNLTSSIPTNITWSTGATTPTIAVSTTSTVTVTTTTANGCTGTSNPITVMASTPPPPPVITASGPTSFCVGGTVQLTSSAATNIWSNSATTQTINVSNSGNYSVIAVLNGCPSSPSAVTSVIVNPYPPVPTITANGPLTMCQGNILSLFSSGTNSENWSNGFVGQVQNVTTSGFYSVISLTAAGCASYSDTVQVIVNPKPVVTMQDDYLVCISWSPVVLAMGTPSGGVYSGSGVVGGTTFSPSITGFGTSIITYTVTNANGCVGTAQGVITVDKCVSVEELFAASLSLYPNPSFGRFTIKSELDKINHVTIIDAVGKIIFSEEYIGAQLIDIDQSTLPSGMYQVIVTSEKHESVRIPLVIQID